MRRTILSIAGTVALFMPLSALAVTSQTFELRKGHVNARWSGSGPLSMQQDDTGIVLTTGDGTGMLLTETALSTSSERIAGMLQNADDGNGAYSDTSLKFFPEAVSIVLSVEKPTEIAFGWVLSNDVNHLVLDVPFTIPRGARQVVSLTLNQDPAWRKELSKVGLKLPPHTKVIFHEMEFHQWSWAEHLWENIRSFWTFDEYRPYSINFVWGPLFAGNPIETGNLYRNLPPRETYATYAVNIFLILGLIALLLVARFRRPGTQKTWWLRSAGILLLAMWILMDARMGAEFLSWVAHDHSTFVAAEGTEDEPRSFRDRDSFYDFAAFAAPLVADRTAYVFFAQQEWPYLGNMRYITYPAIPGFDLENDDTWVIYKRSEISVDPEGRLVFDGDAITGPGKILGRFDENSFVYRTDSPPSP